MKFNFWKISKIEKNTKKKLLQKFWSWKKTKSTVPRASLQTAENKSNNEGFFFLNIFDALPIEFARGEKKWDRISRPPLNIIIFVPVRFHIHPDSPQTAASRIRYFVTETVALLTKQNAYDYVKGLTAFSFLISFLRLGQIANTGAYDGSAAAYSKKLPIPSDLSLRTE